MRWRIALAWGALIEVLVVGVLVLYGFGVIPRAAFGGVPITAVALTFHLPSSLSLGLILRAINAFQWDVLPSIALASAAIGALQAGFLGALLLGVARYPKVSGATMALAVILALATATFLRKPPYPDGMDSNGDGVVSLEEWGHFHSAQPKAYGGYDNSGHIDRESPDYYEREFRRVDCNHDSTMDAYEYGELRWNMRWCESSARPQRPWWR
jgi:hypothetical protein